MKIPFSPNSRKLPIHDWDQSGWNIPINFGRASSFRDAEGDCLEASFTSRVVIRALRGPALQFTTGVNMSSPHASNEVPLTAWLVTEFPVIVNQAEVPSPIDNDQKPGTAGFNENSIGAVPPTSENPNMRTRIKQMLKLLAMVGLMIAVVGCNKTYKTVLGPEESITESSSVEIDGRANAGSVNRVYTDASGHRVAVFNTGTESLRQGTVRVRANGVIALSTDNASGQPLESGAFIPAASSLTVAAKKWGKSALAILAVAAIAAVVCFRRFLAFQAAAPFIPLLVAVALALLTAYSAHGFVVPVVQNFQAKAHSSGAVATTVPSANPAPSAGWSSKAKQVENEVIGFLQSPTDAPRLLAFVLTFVVTLPLFACLIAWLFKKLACRSVVCGLLLVLAMVSSPANAATGGVTYSREFLRDEQRFCQQTLSEVERELASSSRLLDANLNGSPESLVRALFLCDLVGIRLEGEPDRIQQLKSSLGYTRTEEQKRLNASYAELRQQLQIVQLDAAKLSERCKAGSSARTVLQVFLEKQADYRNLIRAGLADAKTVLAECSRQLIQNGNAPQPETKPEADRATAIELARMQQEQVELQGQLAQLKREQNEAAQRLPAPQIVVITNEVRTEKLVPVPTPAPPPEIRYVTNTILATETNRTEEPAAGKTATIGKDVEAFSTDEAKQDQPGHAHVASGTTGGTASDRGNDPGASLPKQRKTLFNLNPVVLCVVGGLILIGLACVVSFAVSGRTRVLQLARDGTPLGPFTIDSSGDVLVLETDPRVEHCSQAGGKATLRPTWRGTVLDPGNESVTVNDEPVQQPRRLAPGDRLTATNADSKPRLFDFLGCDQINEPVEA